MTRSLRALSSEFAEFIDSGVGFPVERVFEEWLARRRGHRLQSGAYSRMKGCFALPARNIESFVVYCSESDQTLSRKRLADATKQFCRARGVFDITDLRRVLELVAPKAEACDRGPAYRGEAFLSSICARTKSWSRRFRPAKSADDFGQIARWLHTELGRLASRDRRHQPEPAMLRAQGLLGSSWQELAQASERWSAACEDSVAFSMDGDTVIGASIALPLAEEAYARIQSESVDPLTIDSLSIRAPSSNLLIEGFSMVARDGCSWEHEPDRALLTSVLAQWATLTRIDGIGSAVPLRLLACATTKATAKRLGSFGFEAIGAKRARTDLVWMERIIHIRAARPLPRGCRGGADAAFWGNWVSIQDALVAAKKNDDGLAA